jgi:hypothetical protein
MQISMPPENVIVLARNTLTTLNLQKLVSTASAGFVAGIVGVNQLSTWRNIPSLQSAYVLLSGGVFCGIVAVVCFLVDPKNRVVQTPLQSPQDAIPAPSTESLIEAALPMIIDALKPHIQDATQTAVQTAVTSAVPDAVNSAMGAVLGTPSAPTGAASGDSN